MTFGYVVDRRRHQRMVLFSEELILKGGLPVELLTKEKQAEARKI